MQGRDRRDSRIGKHNRLSKILCFWMRTLPWKSTIVPPSVGPELPALSDIKNMVYIFLSNSAEVLFTLLFGHMCTKVIFSSQINYLNSLKVKVNNEDDHNTVMTGHPF